MQLQEFCKSKAVQTKPEWVWECTVCGLLISVDDNPATGFTDWSGVVVCPDCNANMQRRESMNDIQA